MDALPQETLHLFKKKSFVFASKSIALPQSILRAKALQYSFLHLNDFHQHVSLRAP